MVTYVSYNNISCKTSRLSKSVAEILVEELNKAGFKVEDTKEVSVIESVVLKLVDLKLFLLLLVDELDQLYKADGKDRLMVRIVRMLLRL